MSQSWELKMDKTVAGVVHAAAARGLAISADHVYGVAQSRAPIEEHTLENSGGPSTDPANLRAAVAFDTPYAVKQHEDMTARHDPGRQAKYLESAMNSETAAVREIIARTIKGEF